ncbi:MAG: LON peptidase substrate-binding domain-containing protein [Saprospiraceae bacterium]
MTDFLPLFPLKLVAYPGEGLNLHIFEPRYKQLIREASQNKTTFGIPAYLDGKVMLYATEMKVLEIAKTHEDGEMDIKTQGVGIVEITEFFKTVPNKLYSGGDIKRMDFKSGAIDPIMNEVILQQVEMLFSILKIDKKIPKSKTNFSLYELAHHVGFNVEQEYEFLTIMDRGERQLYMKNHLEKMIPIVEEAERLRKRVEMNGHFKGEVPPAF